MITINLKLLFSYIVSFVVVVTTTKAETLSLRRGGTRDLQQAPTISTDKTLYAENESIVISWDYTNANVNDWIAIYPSTASSPLYSGSTMWVYVDSKSQSAPGTGGVRLVDSVTFDSNNPDEGGIQDWPLAPGSYKVWLVEDVSAPYTTYASSATFTVSATTPAPTPSPQTSLTVAKSNYDTNEVISVTFQYPNNAGDGAWISLWPADEDETSLPSPSPYWKYICSDTQSSACGNHPTSGTVTIDANAAGSDSWPLTCGSWKAFLITDSSYSSGYSSAAASTAFTINNSPICSGTCPAGLDPISSNTHTAPVDGAVVNGIGFSSCYKPSYQINGNLWQHVGTKFGTKGVWNWLGDNMYADTDDQNTKRQAYNAARDDFYYKTYGPIGLNIPTTGTWDDHDYAWNNMGKYYSCRQQSQNEFVYHFNVPSSDPRHPDQGANQQEGIYSAYMFQQDGSTDNGIHLINIDARYHRSPTYSSFGPCEGDDSTMLGDDQWTWLENELLNKQSEIKVIGSGIQVLPPTYQGGNLNDYCAYGNGVLFEQANSDMNEGPGVSGTSYESWAEIPQERTKLLKLCQESINAGKAKQIIFISGDQHWAEIMAKKVPARLGQAEVTLYEVTASGIDQRWNYNVDNPNRVTYRKANNLGSGDFTEECDFPFSYGAVTYNDCTSVDHNAEWCYKIGGSWGNCEPASNVIVPPNKMTASKEHICTNNSLHVCNAQANYGGIEVDWSASTVTLSIYTPHETDPVAGSVTLDF